MPYLTHDVQLKDLGNGTSIIAAGGIVQVCTAGSPDKATLFDPDSDFASLANPISITNGRIKFAVDVAVLTVDLYIRAPGGQFLVFAGASAQELNEIGLDLRNPNQVYKIPFSHANSTAATEKDTGFELPTDCLVLPDGAGILVQDLDATETIDVGILSGESGGDANGFLAALSVAAVAFVAGKALTTVGSNEVFLASTNFGALLADFNAGTDLANDVGIHNKKAHRGDGIAKTISYTLTTGSDTAAGFAVLPVQLAAAA